MFTPTIAISAFAFAVTAHAATTADLFDDKVLQEVRLTLEPGAWKNLQENYLLDTYYLADFQWSGMAVQKIGIRSRGLGSRNGKKPGLKVDFNHFVSGQRFLGLTSLVLDNLVQDPSMMAERLSMAIYNRLGIPAPREAHARLYINDTYAGLYTIVEPVEKAFLNRIFDEDSGQLFEYKWTFDYRFESLGSGIGSYSAVPFSPKTHESNPDPAIAALIRIANEAPDAEFLEAISPYLNPESFLNYLAVETFVADIDGILGDWGLNNFYLYQHPNKTKIRFIPWDKDVTFVETNRSIWQNADTNVLVRRLLNIPELRKQYLLALERCIQSAEGPGGWLDQEVDRIHKQINLSAMEDTAMPVTFASFSDAVAKVHAFVRERPDFISKQMFETDRMIVNSGSGNLHKSSKWQRFSRHKHVR